MGILSMYTELWSFIYDTILFFCSALYLENLLRNIFAKLNLRGGVSCMPAALLFESISLAYKSLSMQNPSHKTSILWLE